MPVFSPPRQERVGFPSPLSDGCPAFRTREGPPRAPGSFFVWDVHPFLTDLKTIHTKFKLILRQPAHPDPSKVFNRNTRREEHPDSTLPPHELRTHHPGQTALPAPTPSTDPSRRPSLTRAHGNTFISVFARPFLSTRVRARGTGLPPLCACVRPGPPAARTLPAAGSRHQPRRTGGDSARHPPPHVCSSVSLDIRLMLLKSPVSLGLALVASGRGFTLLVFTRSQLPSFPLLFFTPFI